MQQNNSKLAPEPEFDLQDFMNFSHETRISSEALDALYNSWQKWSRSLRAETVKSDSASVLAVWLPEEIESEIDAAWEKSPGEGFMLNNLAQYLCMTAISALVPQTAALGCAPTPQRDAELDAALAKSGAGSESRRYAVMTYMPFRGGCEVCALQNGCPRMTGSMDFMSATLPGYEAGSEN